MTSFLKEISKKLQSDIFLKKIFCNFADADRSQSPIEGT